MIPDFYHPNAEKESPGRIFEGYSSFSAGLDKLFFDGTYPSRCEGLHKHDMMNDGSVCDSRREPITLVVYLMVCTWRICADATRTYGCLIVPLPASTPRGCDTMRIFGSPSTRQLVVLTYLGHEFVRFLL